VLQHILLTRHLGIEHARVVMGISMGGMQTFQWMGQYPEFMDKAIPIDGSPRMTSYDLLQCVSFWSRVTDSCYEHPRRAQDRSRPSLSDFCFP